MLMIFSSRQPEADIQGNGRSRERPAQEFSDTECYWNMCNGFYFALPVCPAVGAPVFMTPSRLGKQLKQHLPTTDPLLETNSQRNKAGLDRHTSQAGCDANPGKPGADKDDTSSALCTCCRPVVMGV